MECKQKSTKGLNRRDVLKYGLYGGLAAGLLPGLWISGCGKRRQVKKHNIVLIVIDTLRADHMGCYGYRRNVTRNLDRLAREGVLFKKAICSAPWTTPSIATILTSQYPCVLGIYDTHVPLNPRFPVFSELLKKNGYATCGIISHTLVSASLGFGRGFDSYDEESIFGRRSISSPSITSKAVSFLRQDRQKPFFLFTHYFDPHYNFLLHPDYNYYRFYKGKVRSNHPILELWHMRDDLSEDDIRYLLSLYDSEIAFTDEYIGKLFDELKKQGVYDDSVIIVTADHGEEFKERGWIGHCATLYQELLHVPLIMKLPGCEPRIIGSPVGLIDIMPTILQYLGMKIPRTVEGKALELSCDAPVRRGPVFSETFNPQIYRPGDIEPIALRSMILGDRKIIYNQRKDSEQIYDLSKDPREQNNLSGRNNEQDKILKALLSKWIAHVKTKENRGPARSDKELFTPEQRKLLESLGYL